MSELLKKLMMMRQLSFSEGEISLLRQRVYIAPLEIIKPITDMMLENPKLIPEIYERIRTTFNKGWADGVREVYGFKPKDYFKWLIDIANIAGWGKSELVTFDEKKYEGTFRTFNALLGKEYKEKTPIPVDHLWRGLTAGGLTQAFAQDIDWLETKCLAMGDPFCEFDFKPRTQFIANQSLQVKLQLPIK